MDWNRYLLVVTLTLLVVLCADDAHARRGGGSRGGSRGGSSYRSSYRSTYRSSSGSRYTSTRYTSYRGGSRIHSSYISYRPAVRHTRIYIGYYNSFYTYYYNMYFYHSGSYIYLNRRRPSGDVSVCANYEANANGTTMGVFTCPNSWEPAEYRYCCGQDYAEYCCKEGPSNAGMIAGIVVGVIILIVIIIIVVCCVMKSGACRDTKTTRTTTTTVYQVPVTTNPEQTYPQGPPEYQPSPYPNQQAPAYDPNLAYPTATPYPATTPYPVAAPDPNATPYPNTTPYPVDPNNAPAFTNPAYEDPTQKMAPPSYDSAADYQSLDPNTKQPIDQSNGIPR